MAGHSVPFTIDYSRYEGTKLVVDAQLYEWDNPCSCGNDHREFDDYDYFYKEYLLSDIEKNNSVTIEVSLT